MENFYRDNGYVVIPKLIPEELTERVVALFEGTVKSFRGKLLHGPDYRVEENKFKGTHLQNALATIQSIQAPELQDFVSSFLEIMTYDDLTKIINILSEEPRALGQTFFYEINWPKGTRLHEDGYFMHHQHDLITAWIALEDIALGAGQLYLYPGTDKLVTPRNEGEFAYDSGDSPELSKSDPDYKKKREQRFTGLKRYFEFLERLVEGYDCLTPCLKKGDVLIFNNEILHGSHPPTTDETRLSAIGHFLPNSLGRKGEIKRRVNGTDVFMNPRNLY